VIATNDHSVGLRELRHRTREVLARVERGEAIDVTDYGRLVARIVPVVEPTPTAVLQQLVDAGRVRRARRPGFRPPMRQGDGTDTLADALAADRDDARR
jgi:prevent-host-death family protein